MNKKNKVTTIKRKEGLFAEIVRGLRRNKASMAGLIIITGFVLAGIFAPLISPYNSEIGDLSEALQTPSRHHLLGTDPLGRDILTRILYGGRISLTVGILSVSIGAAIGVSIGAISGYYSGKVDFVIQRFIDIMLAFPGFLLALTLVAILGIGLRNVIIAVGISSIPTYVRLVRGTTLSIRERDYIEAARALNLPVRNILSRHIILNVLPPIIVQSTLQLGQAITIAAGLGFLGLGVPPPTPEWGADLGNGRAYLFSYPHITTFPGLAIFLAVLSFNLIGDGLRESVDPRLRLQ